MKKGDKIATIGLMIFGISMLIFGLFVREMEYRNYQTGYSHYVVPSVIFLGNILITLGGLMASGTVIALIASRFRLRRPYQLSIALIFLGALLSAIPMAQTYDFYGYDFSYTAFPFSFIGYPLIGLGFAIIVYSYFTNHLRVEVIQNKEDNRIYSTAKVVWKENSVMPTINTTEKREGINEQLMKQHTMFITTETEATDNEESIRYCRYCGKENKTDAVYCEKCGKNIA